MSAFIQGLQFGLLTSVLNRTYGGFNPFCCRPSFPIFFGGGCCQPYYPVFRYPSYSYNIPEVPDYRRFNRNLAYPNTQTFNIPLPSFNVPRYSPPKYQFDFKYSEPEYPEVRDSSSKIGLDTFEKSTDNSNKVKTKTDIKISDNAYNKKYDTYITKYAKQFGVDPNLVKAVMSAESESNPNAVSRKGATGLMQLMPDTAKEMGVTDINDPEQNIMGGVKYLSKMLKRYNGNTELALAAYNAGPGRVTNKIPNIEETKAYVPKVMAYYDKYKASA